jgi:membrane protein implicated in regulation of membrane protease activity
MFAIWDIFYYIFLWLLIGWPESFFTWDILFLLPVTWVGPVLAPVINSLTMIVLAGLILLADRKTSGQADERTSGQADERTSGQADERTSGNAGAWKRGRESTSRGRPLRLTGLEWGLLIIGSLITITAYIQDYSRYMLDRLTLAEWLGGDHQDEVMAYATAYIPESFNWWLFIAGSALFLIALILFSRRHFFTIRITSPG